MEEIIYKGYRIEIEYDDICENPRTYGDNLGEMVCLSRNLGDDHDFTKEEIAELIESGNVIYYNLYLYDHSGITISTTPFSCKFDSGRLGYIYVTKEKAKGWFEWKRITGKRLSQIKKQLLSEVEIYNHYIQGEIYFYQVRSSDGAAIDSCGGFYGFDHEASELMREAKGAIDYEVKLVRKKHFEKLKHQIKNRAPLSSRNEFKGA